MSFLTKKIINLTPDAFGIDLSDLSVKAVALHCNGKNARVVSYGSVPLPAGAVVDGDLLKPEIVEEAIRKVIQSAGPKKLTQKHVICSLPETKEFLRIINVPKMSDEDLKEALQWEIEANIPLTLDQVYYDWQVLDRNLSGDEKKMSVLVVVVGRDTAEQFVEVLEKCGLSVIGLETESVAQSRALISGKKDEDKTTLIVDMGDRRTSFLVAMGTIPCFTSSVPLSSQMISDAVSKMLQIPFDEADKMKVEQGLGSLTIKSPVYRAAEPILENIAKEIERTIDFYSSTLKYSKGVDRILLCGGGSNLQGMVSYMTRRLNRIVELGDTWTAMDVGKEIPVIPREKSIQYSTAIGLALKGLDIYEDFS